MTKAVVFGTFDVVHAGHINYLKSASEITDCLDIGLTPESE
jgi:cytidyltransferase-like protein